MINYITRIIVNHPKKILCILGGVLLFLGYYIQFFGLDASEETLINKEDQDYLFSQEMSDRYQVGKYLIVVYQPKKALFSYAGIELLSQFKQDLLNLPSVTQVTSILDVPLLQTDAPDTIPSNRFPTLLSLGIDRNEAELDLRNSPLYQDMLINQSGQTTALQIDLDSQYDIRDALSQLRTVVRQYQATGDVYLGGMDAIADDVMTFIRQDLVLFGVGIVICMIGILWFIFRRLAWILLSIGCCIISILVMMGVLGALNWKVTVISSNFISLQVILTLSLMIHLIVKYIELSRKSPDKTQYLLVKETIHSKLMPSIAAVLTTITGFGSLMTSSIYPVSTFGWMMVVGLITSLFLTFLLFGAVLCLIKRVSIFTRASWVRLFIAWLNRVTLNQKRRVLVVGLGVMIIGSLGILRLSVENSFINYFSKSTDIYQGLKFIDQNLGGTTPLDIIIQLDQTETNTENNETVFSDEFDDFDEFEMEESDQYWITQNKIDLVKRAHLYLDQQPEIGKVLSLWTTVQIGKQINGGSLNTFETVLLSTLIPEEHKSLLLDPYMSVENNELRLTMRINDSLPNIKRNELLNRIQTELPQLLGISKLQVKLTGAMVLYNNMLQALFDSQIKSLGVVTIAIMMMLLLLFRNFRLAFAAIIPNLLSVVVVLGTMGLLGVPLDMMTTTIAAITVGIAIDDAIHYVYRFKREFELHHSYQLAMENAHHSIGAAMVYTSVTISIGFGILAFSNFIPNVMFGILTALAMIVALFASLTVLPLALIKLKPFGEEK